MTQNKDIKLELQADTLKKTTQRYIFAIGLIALFCIMAFIFNKSQNAKMESDFNIINLSGRQRMISQKIALLAYRNEGKALEEAVVELRNGLDYLVTTRFVSKDYPQIYELYHGPEGILKLVKTLIPLKKEGMLNINKDDVFKASQEILNKFETATLAKQKIAETEFKSGFYTELVILILTLALLLIEIFFIFRPMTAEISKAFTNLNRIEDQALKNTRLALIGETASSIGHEISNPLSVISVSAESLIKSHGNELDQSALNRIKSILSSSKKISVILSALKTQARSSSADSMKPANLGEIVKEALEMLSHKIRHRNIDLVIDDRDSPIVLCRSSEISQVVANIVSNAIDATCETDTPDKKIKISIFTENDQPIIRFEDSGPGVPDGLQDKIFESFITTKQEGKGTGLGLTISKNIMESHGGVLRLNPKISKSCFEMIFKSKSVSKLSNKILNA